MSQRLTQFLQSDEPERVFMQHLRSIADGMQQRANAESSDRFSPLMLGYVGAHNVGADLRVAEMLRQFSTIYQDFQPTVMAIGPHADPELFAGYSVQFMDSYFPDYLESELPRHDAVIACEGSMFTSTFSDILSSIFASGLGCAARMGLPGIGYGADVGAMSPVLQEFVTGYCSSASIFCRTTRSRDRLRSLGIPALSGTDSAWTFDIEANERERLASDVGMDATRRYAVICPVNPFWWPIVAEPKKAQRLPSDPALKELHYRTVFFHSWSAEAAKSYERYVNELALATSRLERQGLTPLLLCMEPLDKLTALRINARLESPVGLLSSDSLSVRHIVSVIASASLVISSRYHATLLAMAQQRPVIGVSMDNRIVDMFAEMDLGDWALDCRSTDLADKIVRMSSALTHDMPFIRTSQAAGTARHIRTIGEMGTQLAALTPHVLQKRRAPGAGWSVFIPPLSRRLELLMDEQA